jgi:hypothetical protein
MDVWPTAGLFTGHRALLTKLPTVRRTVGEIQQVEYLRQSTRQPAIWFRICETGLPYRPSFTLSVQKIPSIVEKLL